MKKIIVIDDDASIRNLIKEMLDCQYDIIDTDNADEVIEQCKKQTVDLVITDLFMPEKSGLDLIEIVRESNRDVKFLAISGGSYVKKCDFLPIAEVIGAHDTLHKPFTMDELRKKVADILHDSESHFRDTA